MRPGLLKRVFSDTHIEFAVFFAGALAMAVGGVAILLQQFQPKIVAWREGTQPAVIDYATTTASTIKKSGDLTTGYHRKNGQITYRVYKLPPELKQKTKNP